MFKLYKKKNLIKIYVNQLFHLKGSQYKFLISYMRY